MTTDYHSQYYAFQLTKRLASSDAEKLSQSLLNASVDLNPHQVEAALFAFQSPLSRGAILADEVGLGKTIEAGLIVSQLWAERKRRILCIVPASLRKQWNRELLEKFFIDSTILEAKNYRSLKKERGGNPFDQGGVVICSYEFARSKADDLQDVKWDLVVIDEAHRLRNVYKKGNKIARAIRDAVQPSPKVLLTATPLQNSLMELYGLVSVVDPLIFGDEDSFRSQFATRPGAATDGQLAALKQRIKLVCQRTLRRQVVEYVPYTNRISITQDFTPTEAETRLYDAVSSYLQKEELFALPSGQRQLITLILRKILASSSFAISATLGTLIDRLEKNWADLRNSLGEEVSALVGDDLEHVDELQEEWKDEGDEDSVGEPKSAEQLFGIQSEIAELRNYKRLAESIATNAKGEALLQAMEVGFRKAEELGAPKKALIFTESRRTQTYLKALLETNGYAGKIVTFNGTNSDPESKQVYADWLKRHEGEECISGSPSADSRAALVEHFRDYGAVMIATESASEGVNLQFCNLVVNFDLPWNPQRIEQRIGRCHRYGQKHDVVVINFLNRKNEADQRVFELLSQKFHLFDGVFGASDEVLGTLESGVDFEKRIFDIYQACRSSDEINAAFDALQRELEEQINARMEDARTKLLEHFDQDVHDRLKMRSSKTRTQVDRFEQWLWWLTKSELGDDADFDDEGFAFTLKRQPIGVSPQEAPLGRYRLVTHNAGRGDHPYRFGHPLVRVLLDRAMRRSLPIAAVVLDRPFHGRVSLVEPLRGRSGWLCASVLTISALESEERLVLTGLADDGASLDQELCEKLFHLSGTVTGEATIPFSIEQRFAADFEHAKSTLLGEADARNSAYFEQEVEKLDRWADDLKEGIERELKELAAQIRLVKKESRSARTLDEKVALQKQVRDLEKRQTEKRKRMFDAQDEVDAKRDSLIAEIQAKLKQSVENRHLFTIRWQVL